MVFLGQLFDKIQKAEIEESKRRDQSLCCLSDSKVEGFEVLGRKNYKRRLKT